MGCFVVAQVALLTSFLVCLSLIAAGGPLLKLFHRPDLAARQAAHSRPTLRLGGVGVTAGLWVAALFAESDLLFLLVLTCAPITISGLLEDLGYAQSVWRRFMSATASGVFALMVLEIALPRVGIAGFDRLFVLYPVAAGFTLFAAVGIVNAFNLVDGLNGLAGSAALVCLGGLALIASQAGVWHVLQPIAVVAAAICGYLFLNYPKGKIFLGDAGAYTIGFVLAWLAIFILAEAPAVSPWAVVLIFFWPVADTLFAIWRRSRRKAKAFHPDRMHFHHVVMRAIEIRVLGRRDRSLSNPLATLVMVPLMVPPAAVGVLAWDNNSLAAVATLGFAAAFVVTYRACVVLARKRRPVLHRRNVEETASTRAPTVVPEV